MEYQNTSSRNLQLQISRTFRIPYFPLLLPVFQHLDQSLWSFCSTFPKSLPYFLTLRSRYIIPIRFCREDIPSSPIVTSEKANAILLKTCKVIETIVEKGFKSGPVNQSSEIDDNKAFLQENPKSKDENKSNKEEGLDKDLDDIKNETNKAAIRRIS